MDDWRDTVRARLAELQLTPTREQEVVEEVCQHLEQRFEELKAGGTSEDQARRIVTDEFREPLELARQMEHLREAQAARVVTPGRPSGLLAGLGDDVRLAARRLCATPVVSLAAILSLALGIGVNTAIFSIADSLFRRPLPVERPEELVVVLAQPARVSTWSNPVWEQIRERQHDLFETAFAYSARISRFNLAPTGAADLVDGVWVSGEYFEGLGVRPVLGRAFSPADDQRGGGRDGPVAVISDALWRSRFGQASDVVGRRVTVDRVPFIIVGVLPAGFFGADVGTRFDIALPLGTEPLLRGTDSYLDRPTTSWLAVMARLKNRQHPSQAQSALLAALPDIRTTTTVESAPIGTSNMRGRYRRPLLVLLGVVSLVLAIACGNVASLQIVRALERRKELSVRLALGASRWRVARELLVESFILAALGATIGLLLAHWLAGVLIRQLATHVNTVFISVPIDERVVGYTAIAAVVSAIVFGTLPAWLGLRTSPAAALRTEGRSAGGHGPTAFLVSVQVAFSVILLVAAGLMVRTFASLAHQDLGFDRDVVLVAQLDLRNSSVAISERSAFYAALSTDVSGLPGVAQSAVSAITPIGGSVVDNYVEVESILATSALRNVAFQNVVTPGWFDTYVTRIVSGRDFTPQDRSGSTPVAIVNESFARRFMAAMSPLGHRIRLGDTESPGPWLEIVGVAADAAYRSVRESPPATVYLPLAQTDAPPATMRLSVRAAVGAPGLLTNSVAAAIARADQDVVATFTLLNEQVDAALVQERMLAMVSGLFGILALGLAAMGIFGTTWYAVTRRHRELGIRLALGATPSGVRWLELTRATIPVGLGVAAGVGGSMWASGYLATLLYGVEPFDWATVAAAVTTVALVGLLAAWIPATRASRIDPADVLRDT